MLSFLNYLFLTAVNNRGGNHLNDIKFLTFIIFTLSILRQQKSTPPKLNKYILDKTPPTPPTSPSPPATSAPAGPSQGWYKYL